MRGIFASSIPAPRHAHTSWNLQPAVKAVCAPQWRQFLTGGPSPVRWGHCVATRGDDAFGSVEDGVEVHMPPRLVQVVEWGSDSAQGQLLQTELSGMHRTLRAWHTGSIVVWYTQSPQPCGPPRLPRCTKSPHHCQMARPAGPGRTVACQAIHVTHIGVTSNQMFVT
jgi:hypothetical protein